MGNLTVIINLGGVARRLFDLGLDTIEIAGALDVAESLICDVLIANREAAE